MMEAVHRYEGTVNQVLGDGIMALFGAPIAHEDHAVRACYAALAMQAAMQGYAEEVRRTQGLAVQMRVGLNSGEVVVRAIGNDLHMDYSAVGLTTTWQRVWNSLLRRAAFCSPPIPCGWSRGWCGSTLWGRCPSKGWRSLWKSSSCAGLRAYAAACRRRLRGA